MILVQQVNVKRVVTASSDETQDEPRVLAHSEDSLTTARGVLVE